MIRPATPADARAIADIYNPYIRETCVTFEEEPLSVPEVAGRIEAVSAAFPWLVWEEAGVVVGYAYAGTWRTRHAYRYAVETAIYLAPAHQGRGLGPVLYRALLEELKRRGFHLVLGCLALPNEPSVRLHEALGFRKVGHMREAGWKFGTWVDVGFWELLLDEGGPPGA